MLPRAVLDDDETQQRVAIETLERAEMVAISAQSLWVLDRGYKTARADVAAAINRLLDMRNIAVNRPAIRMARDVLGKFGADRRAGEVGVGNSRSTPP